MTIRPLRPGRALAAALLALAALTAAVALPSAARAAEAPPGKGWIRAAHFIPGFSTARIDLTPTTAGTGTAIVMSPGASYGDATPYLKVAPGAYTLTIRPQGASLATEPLLSRAFTVTSGRANTVAAVGSSAAPRLVVLTDDLTPPASGSARVRVVSASSLVQTLSVVAIGGPTLAKGAVLGQTTGYTTVPQGPWTIDLGLGTALETSKTVRLNGGSVYTAAVLDSGTSAIKLTVLTDAVGASSTPAGGAQTGGGGMAGPSEQGSPATPLVVSVLLLVLGVVVATRRRSARG